MFGLPGTGKTMNLVELVQQLIHRSKRVLVCGTSNISVDPLLERLSDKHDNEDLVRISQPAKVLPSCVKHTLNVLFKAHEDTNILLKLRNR